VCLQLIYRYSQCLQLIYRYNVSVSVADIQVQSVCLELIYCYQTQSDRFTIVKHHKMGA
jgi:hypothetical protein